MNMEKKPNKDTNVLVTSGPTMEPIDPVRHISNFATGRLGVEIAKEGHERGYNILLLHGIRSIVQPPDYINTVRFTSTHDLLEKVLGRIGQTDIYISSAAVSDYTPIPVDEKISSGKDDLIIKLRPTPKVMKEARAAARPETEFVAFKLNYNISEEELIAKAMESYGDTAKIIVANDLARIRGNKHEAMLLYNGKVIDRMKSKREIAVSIFDCLEQKVQSR